MASPAGSTATSSTAPHSSPTRVTRKLRYNWNTPIGVSPNEKGTLYIGSQFLFQSRDHGVTWDRIRPICRPTIRSANAGAIGRNHGRQFVGRDEHNHLLDLREPARAGPIWVGTDDGNVELTRDGGRSWTNLRPNLGMPQGNWISWVEASRFSPAVAYVADDRHAYGDCNPTSTARSILAVRGSGSSAPARLAFAATPM